MKVRERLERVIKSARKDICITFSWTKAAWHELNTYFDLSELRDDFESCDNGVFEREYDDEKLYTKNGIKCLGIFYK